MTYNKTNWRDTIKDVNGNIIEKGTPLASTNLNKMEDGIANATEKAEKAEDDLVKVNQQLADTTVRVMQVDDKANRELVSRRNRKPMITIIDDDGRSDVLSKWLPLLQEKQFKLTVAVITGWVGNANYMNWSQLDMLNKQYGVDLVNHTHTHPHLGTLQTEAEIREQFEKSTEILMSRGYSYDVMVYPYGSRNATVRRVAREYFRSAFYIDGGVNTPPLNSFDLNRISLLPSTGTMGSVESYTKYIDEAVEKNGWIVFMSHSQYESFDAEKVKAIVDYANTKGIEWVHVNEGLSRIGNVMDIGNYSNASLGEEYTVIDADGIMHSKSNAVAVKYSPDLPAFEGAFSERPITHFPLGALSLNLSTSTAGLPGAAGSFITYRHANIDYYGYQIYMPYNSDTIYRRRWDRNSNKWTSFTSLLTQNDFNNLNMFDVKPSLNNFTASTPIADYPNNRVTTFAINNAGATGFPDNSAGVVTTYKVGGNGWHRQEYRKYRSNEVWARYVETDGTWTSWVKISAV